MSQTPELVLRTELTNILMKVSVGLTADEINRAVDEIEALFKKERRTDLMLANSDVTVRVTRQHGQLPVTGELLAKMAVLTLLGKWKCPQENNNG